MAAQPVSDLVKPSKNPVNLFDLPQNQPIIPDTFAPAKITADEIIAPMPVPQNQPIIPDTFAPVKIASTPPPKPSCLLHQIQVFHLSIN